MIKKVAGAAYNGLILAGLLTMLCVRSVVICMHINMGTLFFASFIGSSVLLGAVSFWKDRALGPLWSLCDLGLCGAVLACVYRFIYRQALPAKILFTVRIALHRQAVSERAVFGTILAVLIGGFALVALANRRPARP